MRAFKILPKTVRAQVVSLSFDARRRLEWMDWYMSHGQNARLACRHFGLSPDTFYLWKNRFNKYNLSSLEFNTKTRRPHKLREMTTNPSTLKLIYEIRLEDARKSKYEIQEELKRAGIKVSTKVIQKVINRHFELRNPEHQKRVQKHRNYKIARVRASRELKEKDLGSLIQIDTKHLYILGQRFYIFVAIDCKSRYGFAWAYKTASSVSAADFLLKVLDYFPFSIKSINTDNGGEYLLNFHNLCEQLSITHYFSHPHTPKMNSRVERLIKTLEYEFLHYRELLPELEEVRSICQEFNTYYNQERFNQALKYQTPQEFVLSYQKGEVYVI